MNKEKYGKHRGNGLGLLPSHDPPEKLKMILIELLDSIQVLVTADL